MGAGLTVLCITTYEEGQVLGCRVFLLTVEKLHDADWPRDSLDDIFNMRRAAHRGHSRRSELQGAYREHRPRGRGPLDTLDE
jgi:hypothetical protein